MKLVEQKQAQNHNSNIQKTFDLDEFRRQSQEFDVQMRDYECQLDYFEVQTIKSAVTRMKVLVDKIKGGENSEVTFEYLYKQIENIDNVMKDK